jgi:hypothetical protein
MWELGARTTSCTPPSATSLPLEKMDSVESDAASSADRDDKPKQSTSADESCDVDSSAFEDILQYQRKVGFAAPPHRPKVTGNLYDHLPGVLQFHPENEKRRGPTQKGDVSSAGVIRLGGDLTPIDV